MPYQSRAARPAGAVVKVMVRSIQTQWLYAYLFNPDNGLCLNQARRSMDNAELADLLNVEPPLWCHVVYSTVLAVLADQQSLVW